MYSHIAKPYVGVFLQTIRVDLYHSETYLGVKQVLWKAVYLETLNKFPERLIFVAILFILTEASKGCYKPSICSYWQLCIIWSSVFNSHRRIFSLLGRYSSVLPNQHGLHFSFCTDHQMLSAVSVVHF
jgi:hypothetical protein